jgi:hypothetical protein
MLDVLRRWLRPNYASPPVPDVKLTDARERRRIEERTHEIEARLQELRLRSRLAAEHRLHDRRRGGPNLTQHRRRRNDTTNVHRENDTQNEGLSTC